MQLQAMVRSFIASVGIIALGIAGCTQGGNFEASSQQQTYTTPTPSSPSDQTQVDPNPTVEVGTVNPDVVYIPTPQPVVDEMLRLADVQSTDLVYDLGSGDGRIVITAAQEVGARGIGIDIDPQRIQEAKENAQKAGVSDRVEFREQDLFETDFSDATVVTLYLLPELNLKLRPKLLRELKPGTRIVSHAFDMGDWKPEQILQVNDRIIYYWVVPETPPANLL
ncbi:Ribosomal protein L11 methylase [Planktothrix serta PCC 8927]|uniref:Ribosomal protein L11 methylase n=1 Tax=Planktothrix serta PCC 8927 TaxID=671068 RepID=A0A7Z9BRX2_9CYAN|nr:methyltransferase domain-containing protein [Planktothrix serta]VXD16117.1 Ribosomal protein L11 methylase [Planktothrix serta PCC 8927]